MWPRYTATERILNWSPVCNNHCILTNKQDWPTYCLPPSPSGSVSTECFIKLIKVMMYGMWLWRLCCLHSFSFYYFIFHISAFPKLLMQNTDAGFAFQSSSYAYMTYLTCMTCMVLWQTPYVRMSIWVSKEALGPQEWSQSSYTGCPAKLEPLCNLQFFIPLNSLNKK